MGRGLKYLAYLLLIGLVAFLVYAAVADLSVPPQERTLDVPAPEGR
jgi:hypothetical protein